MAVRSLFLALTAAALVLTTGAAPLRTLPEINRVRAPDSTNVVPFEVCGQVLNTFSLGQSQCVTITDGQTGFSFYNLTGVTCQSGDLVHLTGFVNRNPGNGEVGIFAETLEILGAKPLPETTEMLADSDRPIRFGHLQGVVSHVLRDELDANYNWIVLRTPYGEICVAATEYEYSFAGLEALIDAKVLVRGGVSRRHNIRKTNRFSLCLFGKSGLELIKPAPIDPFSAPPVGPSPSLHRQRLAGTVVACGQAGILVRTDDGRLLQTDVRTTEGDAWIGRPVTAVGFVQETDLGIRFENALLRPENGATAPPEQAARLTERDLFTDRFGNPVFNTLWHGKVIRLRGRLVGTRTESQQSGLLRFELANHTLFIDTTPLSSHLRETLETGSTLDVSGICIAEFAPGGISAFQSFNRFLIVPRTDGDIVLVSRPPWWTTAKFLVLTCILILVLIAVLVWNWSLRILSERRGHALSLALTARVRAESRTQERTRLALELHDSISQSLTGVALQIDAATTTTAIADARRTAYLQTAKNLLSSCRKSLQECLWDLRSRTFEEKDMAEAIVRTLAPFKDKCRILVRFNVPRDILSESATHAVLSIVRELAANAIRHGHASHIRIAGELRDGNVRFSVSDDGTGFDPGTAPGPHDGHFGIQGIRERINDFNGNLDIASTPGTGTKVIVSLAAGEIGPVK